MANISFSGEKQLQGKPTAYQVVVSLHACLGTVSNIHLQDCGWVWAPAVYCKSFHEPKWGFNMAASRKSEFKNRGSVK